ncbi:TPA: LLM class oxidoreductase [Providencia rettgeri]|uniref:LLM class oxidoreductase n=1 Tax=unclassified Providencia TaxID=2633465 RepID=UPI00234B4600|nr:MULTISPECIES: LLM class oxidoreductase [unclassified Providencia]HEP0306833.1 LLM class oxidoreductase [Providencia rettgeri]
MNTSPFFPKQKAQPSSSFASHVGYSRMFSPNKLTVGIFLPLRFYQGDTQVLKGQIKLIEHIDEYNFAAVWVRDIPLFDPLFGDAGQLFDPLTYLSFIAARTKNVALVTGSSIFSLRHPIDLAKAATTIDQLSGNRLVMGIASGDRAIEFPAYGINYEQRAKRFAQAVDYFRQLMADGLLNIQSPLGEFNRAQLLPKPITGQIPLIVTGGSGQSKQWIADYSDGWLSYPEATSHPEGALRLAEKIASWRALIPEHDFRPHMTNEWIDLVDDPDFPRTPLRGGFTLRTGRNGLIQLLEEWQAAGVNHAAIGIQYSERPALEVLQEMAEEVLPHFPSHQGMQSRLVDW